MRFLYSALKRSHEHFPVILCSSVKRQLPLFLATPAPHAQRPQKQSLFSSLDAQTFVITVSRVTVVMREGDAPTKTTRTAKSNPTARYRFAVLIGVASENGKNRTLSRVQLA